MLPRVVNERVVNFSAGPATLPLTVLEEVQRDLLSLPGVGASALEVSHRSAWFTGVIEEAEANLRELLGIPQTHRVVFCQGGATQQFSMVSLNFLRAAGAAADYVVTGAWGQKALEEAAREAATQGEARLTWTDAAAGFVRAPSNDELAPVLTPGAAYVHVTTNETIHGVEYPADPVVAGGVPLFADMSSDFLSRQVDVPRYGLIYAGAQKNAGPAGVTVAIVREDLLSRVPDGLPALLDYRTYTEHGSLYNTPPVFSIYVLMLVTRWLLHHVGGLTAQRRRNEEKAGLVYGAIDDSDGFYRGHAQPGSRSLMNVTWRLATEDLERSFVKDAAAEGLVELKGHRTVGGIRASLYNAMPSSGVAALADFMRAFAGAHA
jgi:phosphoserine aminotransferase